MIDSSKTIISHPDILGGKPVFKGTRVPVSNLIEYIKSGHTINDFLQGFPTVNNKQVKNVLSIISQNILQSANTSRRTLRRKTKVTV